MSTDAIVLLKEDHQEVRKQFRAFRKSGQTAVQKQGIVDTILELLTVHTYIENEVMYPRVREGLGRKQLQELGEELLEARKRAPRRPEQPSAMKKAIDAVVS